MKNVGIIGAVFAALCCFTPLLPVMLGAIGLSSLIPILYRDSILLPVLAIFIAIAVFGYLRARRQK